MPKLEKDWTISDFYKVIWSDDESKFNLFGSNGRVHVRRWVGENFLPECGDRTVKFGGGNVIMWGCITCDGVGPLIKVKGRINSDDYIKLFSDTLLSFTASMGPKLFYHPVFMLYHYRSKLLAGTVYTCFTPAIQNPIIFHYK